MGYTPCWGDEMSYQISKYDAIKVALQAEESSSNKLARKVLRAIQRAASYEITSKNYSDVYIITENEKKYFERVSPKCIISAIKEER